MFDLIESYRAIWIESRRYIRRRLRIFGIYNFTKIFDKNFLPWLSKNFTEKKWEILGKTCYVFLYLFGIYSLFFYFFNNYFGFFQFLENLNDYTIEAYLPKILKLFIFSPLIGVGFILVLLLVYRLDPPVDKVYWGILRSYRAGFKLKIKNLGFNFTLLTFFCAILILLGFDPLISDFQGVIVFNKLIFPYTNFLHFYVVGVDGISLFFLILTAFICPLCILFSWDLLHLESFEYSAFYIVNFLLLEFFVINTFCVLDIFYFFIFFESILIPMFFLIGIWGPGERKIKANYYFAFYTLFGSAFLLLSILLVTHELGSSNFFVLFNSYLLNTNIQLIVWIGLFFSFAIKIPIFPFHIWLPEAHVEAPTTGSVILASILLKLGGYGFIRFLPLVPYAFFYFSPVLYTLGVVSIFYASMSTIRQIDLKKIIAYSSIAHMNLIVLGIFSLNYQSMQGSIFLMLSHGLVSSGLFFLVGMLYDRYGSKLLYYYGGLVVKMPIWTIFFFFFSFANLAFPGTSNFVGEFITLIGIAEKNLSIMIIGAGGMLFSSIYSMWLFNRVSFGTLKTVFINSYCDILRKEFYVLLPLALFTLILGLVPNCVLSYTAFSVKLWVNHLFF